MPSFVTWHSKCIVKRTCARVLDDDAYHSSTHPWRYRGSFATSKSVTIAQYCWYFRDCLSTAAKNMHMQYFRCTFIGSHWWCVGGQALRWKLRTPTTVHANRFHVAVCLFSNRSQSGRQNVIRASDTQMRLVCHFFLTIFWRLVCDPLPKRPTATWNLFACTVVGSCCTRIWAKQGLNRAKKWRNVKRR